MEAKFYLGIPEIDAQHEEIHRLVCALLDVVANKNQRHLVGPALKRLNYLLESHFAAEEALMGMVNYAGLPQHKKMHASLLQLFAGYLRQPAAAEDYDKLGKGISDKVLGHVMEHDIHMTAMIRDYLRPLHATAGGKAPHH